MASIFQIDISRKTKCLLKDSFRKSSHIIFEDVNTSEVLYVHNLVVLQYCKLNLEVYFLKTQAHNFSYFCYTATILHQYRLCYLYPYANHRVSKLFQLSTVQVLELYSKMYQTC